LAASRGSNSARLSFHPNSCDDWTTWSSCPTHQVRNDVHHILLSLRCWSSREPAVRHYGVSFRISSTTGSPAHRYRLRSGIAICRRGLRASGAPGDLMIESWRPDIAGLSIGLPGPPPVGAVCAVGSRRTRDGAFTPVFPAASGASNLLAARSFGGTRCSNIFFCPSAREASSKGLVIVMASRSEATAIEPYSVIYARSWDAHLSFFRRTD